MNYEGGERREGGEKVVNGENTYRSEIRDAKILPANTATPIDAKGIHTCTYTQRTMVLM
jgi:hypothetical protein